jgi:hypothetical protein
MSATGNASQFCMRVSDEARKNNRHGGAIFIHDDLREEKGIDVFHLAVLVAWRVAARKNARDDSHRIMRYPIQGR